MRDSAPWCREIGEASHDCLWRSFKGLPRTREMTEKSKSSGLRKFSRGKEVVVLEWRPTFFPAQVLVGASWKVCQPWRFLYPPCISRQDKAGLRVGLLHNSPHQARTLTYHLECGCLSLHWRKWSQSRHPADEPWQTPPNSSLPGGGGRRRFHHPG